MRNAYKDSSNKSLEIEEAIVPLKLLEVKFLFTRKATLVKMNC